MKTLTKPLVKNPYSKESNPRAPSHTCMLSCFSRVRLFATLRTVDPLSHQGSQGKTKRHQTSKHTPDLLDPPWILLFITVPLTTVCGILLLTLCEALPGTLKWGWDQLCPVIIFNWFRKQAWFMGLSLKGIFV